MLGGGPEEAKQKFMNTLQTALDAGGLILKFVGDGFKKFTNKFFETNPIEIEEGMGRRSAATKIVEVLGMKEFLKDRDYLENDQVAKFPNIMNLLNPLVSVPMMANSFFGDMFSGTSSAGTSPTSTPITAAASGSVDESSQIPMETNASVAGATGRGMRTGPAGYDRIGAGAAYHVDTKFHKSIGMGGMIAAMDKLADEYTARGKEIVFSGQGYARLKAYKSNLSSDEKRKLMQSAIAVSYTHLRAHETR